nr:Enp1 [Serratia proteamaculans]
MRIAMLGGIIVVIAAFSWSTRYYYQQSIIWQEKAKEANASVRKYENQIELIQSQHRKLAELDEHHTEKLNEAEQENTVLRTQLARGHRRMLVSGQISCPDRTSPSTRSLGYDGPFELSADTGQRILSIREGIIRDQQKLMYLQSYIRQFCLKD